MCARSLNILNRTILVPTHPLHTAEDAANIIHNIKAATRVALGHAKKEEALCARRRPSTRPSTI
jgi:hypothetical protein